MSIASRIRVGLLASAAAVGMASAPVCAQQQQKPECCYAFQFLGVTGLDVGTPGSGCGDCADIFRSNRWAS